MTREFDARRVMRRYHARALAAMDDGRTDAAEAWFRKVVDAADPATYRERATWKLVFTCAKSAGDILMERNAAPEAVPLRETAVAIAKRACGSDPSWEPVLFDATLDLARAYQGPIGYMVQVSKDPSDGLRLVMSQPELRAIRARYESAGKWPTWWFPAPHWHARAITPLADALELARSRVADHPRRWGPRLADGLLLLAESMINGESLFGPRVPLDEIEDRFSESAKRSASYERVLTRARELRDVAENPGTAEWVHSSDFTLKRSGSAEFGVPMSHLTSGARDEIRAKRRAPKVAAYEARRNAERRARTASKRAKILYAQHQALLSARTAHEGGLS